MFFDKIISNKIQCGICPHNCLLNIGKTGICGVMSNQGGTIKNMAYGLLSAINTDPVEKKPLYHFYPGSQIMSIGSYGCNFKCNFCQNWQISQINYNNINNHKAFTVNQIANMAVNDNNNIGLAYTYNEPTVWFNFMHELAIKMQITGKKNVMVTNGFINPKPLAILLDYIDAFNVDLKAFDNNFYNTLVGGQLQPVINTLKTIAKSNCHLEITYLVIPGKNDNTDTFTDMVNFIANELGTNIVLHLSRYFPNYKQTQPPTNQNILNNLYFIAKQKLKYVYIGNTNSINTTYCPNCNAELINRDGYKITFTNNYVNGKCNICNSQIINFT